MTDMQHNPEGENSFNQMPGHTPDDASDDTCLLYTSPSPRDS